MSVPVVIPASKPHTMTVQQCNVRQRFKQKVLNEPHFIISTKKPIMARDCLSSGTSVKPAKKCKNRRKQKNKTKSNQGKIPVQLNDCETTFHTVTKQNNRGNQVKRNVPNRTKSQNFNPSTSVVYCTVRKIASLSKPKSTWHNTTSSSSLDQPQTGSSKHTHSTETVEVKTQKQSWPPPLQQRNSPIQKEVGIRKVYYSEAQSHMLAGIPCVPPASPMNDVLIAVEIVPCMADIKSQQTIKTKLKNLEIRRQKADEKLRAKFLKEEQRREKEQKQMMKQQRRAEIYALNEVMTELERKKFLQFMKEKNNGTTKISLKV